MLHFYCYKLFHSIPSILKSAMRVNLYEIGNFSGILIEVSNRTDDIS